MKKHTLFWLVALISVLTACGGKSTTETKFHVIFDNAAPPHHAFGHTLGHTLYRSGELLIAGDIMHGVHFPTVEGVTMK